ncbi:uncharacterized protein LACBIDRAFT_308357 [Laccaria bicolor S238N-H82]|uniref:Predicted protein n=1 Tax=Laccaria bicolor (strain S238N-H82 / ATCC MYA-4686) TaxID=486041 RepID=B0DE81_LACBS|nr:uncharacterized protein LACBIDRAFT_298886 [Laccaria bicolor S238N-H82]XP_001886777.1 uncharacterized protein LACBIDRAFT_308357 [Laccaria bicolor S238N-H82]EDR02733.1 predicted protein [Laccaria bicolor S238N-H82]EDR07219.1 predicted protein [Laccaria bicolor S238N-H82]|eukprot:XP_001882150.1 predicted protein [Laccaria bicolor S238N-H82]
MHVPGCYVMQVQTTAYTFTTLPPLRTTNDDERAASSPLSQPLATSDSIRAPVGRLLTGAYCFPLSTAASLAFNQLVQPTSRFQLTLHALLPLQNPNTAAEGREKAVKVPSDGSVSLNQQLV